MSFFGLYYYAAIKVKVFNEGTGKLESFSLLEEGELHFIIDSEKEVTNKELDDLMWMYLKDKFNTSNEAWREFSVKAKDMPELSQIKETDKRVKYFM